MISSDSKTTAKNMREAILNKHNVSITVKQTGISDYEYTITNGHFTLVVCRLDSNNELDTLLQAIRYIDSATHKIAFAEAKAYYISLITIEDALKRERSKEMSDVRAQIQQRFRQANQVDLFRNIEDLGLQNIDRLHCYNTIGLEDSRRVLLSLYQSLKDLKKICDSKLVDYKSLIPLTNAESENN